MKRTIKLTHGKHFYGGCGSSNWREAGEIFEAEVTEKETGEIEARVRTPFMIEDCVLLNWDAIGIQDFEIVEE